MLIILTVNFVFAINTPQHLRMARNVQLGKVSVEMEEEVLDPTYCQTPPDELIQALESGPYQLYGIVGLKSKGKTSTLQLVARNLPNVVHVQMQMAAGEDVCDVLYRRLKKSVYHLPWFLNTIRHVWALSSKDIVEKVFWTVNKNTKKLVWGPVTGLASKKGNQMVRIEIPRVFM